MYLHRYNKVVFFIIMGDFLYDSLRFNVWILEISFLHGKQTTQYWKTQYLKLIKSSILYR